MGRPIARRPCGAPHACRHHTALARATQPTTTPCCPPLPARPPPHLRQLQIAHKPTHTGLGNPIATAAHAQPLQTIIDHDCRTNQFGETTHNDDGTTVSAAILGQTGSSTRSEILGTIIATCHAGGIHIGVDNSTALDTLRQLLVLARHIPANTPLTSITVRRLQKLHCKGPLRKPWKPKKH